MSSDEFTQCLPNRCGSIVLHFLRESDTFPGYDHTTTVVRSVLRPKDNRYKTTSGHQRHHLALIQIYKVSHQPRTFQGRRDSTVWRSNIPVLTFDDCKRLQRWFAYFRYYIWWFQVSSDTQGQSIQDNKQTSMTSFVDWFNLQSSLSI